MISTVTTTTVTTIASTSVAAGLGLVAVICLIALLITKELTGAEVETSGATGAIYPWVQSLNRALNVAIIPLLIVFSFIVLVKVLEVL